MNTNFRLEYNEKQHQFHLERFEGYKPGTYGWETIDETSDENIQSAFIDYMEERYRKLPLLKVVQTDYRHFMRILFFIDRRRYLLPSLTAPLKEKDIALYSKWVPDSKSPDAHAQKPS